jgi:hypothetical protein
MLTNVTALSRHTKIPIECQIFNLEFYSEAILESRANLQSFKLILGSIGPFSRKLWHFLKTLFFKKNALRPGLIWDK